MDSIYPKVLNRNLNEVRDAWFEWRTLLAIENVRYPFPESSFFNIAHKAIFNCSMSHLMKVLDLHKDSASFWYIYKEKKEKIDNLHGAAKRIESLKELSNADRLKHIRDKTHFHIDKLAVVDHQQAWRNANITSKEIYDAILNLIYILQPLCKEEFGENFPMDYDAEKEITLLVQEAEKFCGSKFSD